MFGLGVFAVSWLQDRGTDTPAADIGPMAVARRS
jgi:hypothetical protein